MAGPITQEALLREAAEESLLRESHRRRFLYNDVERLIEEGFLTHNIVLNNVVVTFRSLTSGDYADLLNATFPEMPLVVYEQQLVAKSIYKIGGLPVTSHQENFWLSDLWVNRLPQPIIKVFISIVDGLNRRVDRAAERTEAYCFEPYSRQLWYMAGRELPYKREEMGLIRRLWVAYNITEDVRKEDSRRWEHTRAYVSVQSYKAAKAMADHDRTWEEREKNRRKRVIEDAVNYIIQGPLEEQEALYVTIGGKSYLVPKVREASTLDELEDELNRWIAGEKDYHDLVVDEYEDNVRKAFLERQAEMEAKRRDREEMEDLLEQAGIQQEGTRLVGYTPAQMREMGRTFKTGGVSTEGTSKGHARLFDRYLKHESKKGWIGEGGRVEPAREAAPEGGSPEASLQKRVEGRKPSLFPTPPMDPDKVRGSDG